MKKVHLLLFFLFLGFYAHSQCNECDKNNPNIIKSGNYYSSKDNAQSYWWEVCEGNATIVGSNTSKKVKIICNDSKPFKINLVKFNKGECVETCKVYSCQPFVPQCPTKVYYSNEGGCTSGIASILANDNIKHVDWKWAIGSFSGRIIKGGTTEPIYYPNNPRGNWNNEYIIITASVTMKNGERCKPISTRYLMNNCQAIWRKSKINIFPMPSKNNIFKLDTKNNFKIEKILLIDNFGNTEEVKMRNNTLDLNNKKPQTYYLKVIYSDGIVETKSIILSK